VHVVPALVAPYTDRLRCLLRDRPVLVLDRDERIHLALAEVPEDLELVLGDTVDDLIADLLTQVGDRVVPLPVCHLPPPSVPALANEPCNRSCDCMERDV